MKALHKLQNDYIWYCVRYRGLCQTCTLIYLENRDFISSSILKIYKILGLPHLPKRKHALVKVIHSETGHSQWKFRYLLLWRIAWSGKSVAVGDSRSKNSVTVCSSVYWSFPYKHWSRNVTNIQLPLLNEAKYFSNIEVFSATAAQRAWAQLLVTQMLCCLCGDQQ